MLLDHGADLEGRDPDFGSAPLVWAAGKGDRPMVDFLLERGAVVEPDNGIDDRTSPIGWARRHDHQEIANLLSSHLPTG